jgi:signal transduction histidine kinase
MFNRPACRWFPALVLSCCALLLTKPAPAQAPPRILPRDTLLAQLARPRLPDTTRVMHLVHLNGYLMFSELERAQTYGQQAVALARRIGYGRGEAMALSNLASTDYYGGNYASAERHFEQTLVAARRARLPEQVGHAYMGLGNVAQALGDVPKALGYFGQAHRAYADSPPGTRRIGQLLVSLNSAKAYRELKQPVAAARSLRQALGLFDQSIPPRLRASVLTELADVQLRAGAPDSAKGLLQRALTDVAGRHLPQSEANAQALLAEIALVQHQPQLARQLALQTLALSQQTGDVVTREAAMLSLAQALHALRRPEAYDTLARYLVLHDTLNNQNQADAVLTAQAGFDNREQQAQIRALQQERRLAREVERLRSRQQLMGVAAGVTLLLLLAGGLFGHYRRRQRQRLAASAAALRQRLAADLHDDVGHLLTQLTLQSSLLRETAPAAPGLQQRLDALSSTARHATQQMTDVVWNLHDEVLTLPQLLTRMRDHAHQVLPAAGLDGRFEVPAPLPGLQLPAELRHNVYLIYKEALHNIVKHAQATLVTVTLTVEAGTLHLTVADDGEGHDGAARPGGHGLRNMQARAQAVGGQVRYQPRAQGFAVEMVVPLGQ